MSCSAQEQGLDPEAALIGVSMGTNGTDVAKENLDTAPASKSIIGGKKEVLLIQFGAWRKVRFASPFALHLRLGLWYDHSNWSISSDEQ